MREYVFRVVDRGSPRGVPVVDAYLLLLDGGVERCLLSTLCNRLSPPEVESLAAEFAGFGVTVERESRPLPGAGRQPAGAEPEHPPAAPAPAEPAKPKPRRKKS